MTLLSTTHDDAISVFCMHDARRRNALSEEMLTEFIGAFDTLPSSTRAVILRAAPGDPVWCAGFDIRALHKGHDPLSRDGLLQGLFERIAACPAPVIGMVQGTTWGGGTDLALRCDMLIADSSAAFAFTPARLGLPYDGDGLLNALLRVGPNVALEMFATAAPIGASRAFQCGILNHLVDPADIERFTTDLATRIAENAPMTVTSAKRHLRALAKALPLPVTEAQALAESRTRALMSDDYAEGLAAFAAKRRPVFTGR